LKNRLPSFANLIPVYSVIAFFVFGWVIYRYAWRLPSWLHYLTMGELLGVFSYAMLTGLIESLFLIGLLILLSIALPARFLRDIFVVRGTAIAFGWLISLVAYWILLEYRGTSMEPYLAAWTVGALMVSAVLAWFSTRLRWLGTFLSGLSDRVIVFLFLIMPLTALSLVVILVRNVF
jgi:hypothetical protein